MTSPAPAAVPIVIVMGVSGAGKTTLGQALAARHGFAFHDADDFHPPANVEKMRAGIPLTDADRGPWLDRLAGLLAAADAPLVLACSALKQRYRAVLAAAAPGALFVHLTASPELVRQRVAARPGHYMPASLIESQFAALELPGPDANVLTLSSALSVDELCAKVMARLSGNA